VGEGDREVIRDIVPEYESPAARPGFLYFRHGWHLWIIVTNPFQRLKRELGPVMLGARQPAGDDDRRG
jgi:hypothetical protein